MEDESTDWAAWSRDAVRLMQERNRAWQARFALSSNSYEWDLDSATMVFERDGDNVEATICFVGTVSEHEGTFLWAWANEAIPEVARRGLEVVRAFGEQHDLPLLAEPESPADRAQGIELLAAAGRVRGAEGAFVATAGDVTCFLLLSDFRAVPKGSPGARSPST